MLKYGTYWVLYEVLCNLSWWPWVDWVRREEWRLNYVIDNDKLW
jgi:hypothetical protein